MAVRRNSKTTKGRGGRPGARRDGRGSRALFRRRKFCRFTAEGVKQIDYKDIDVLKEFINENGKIIPDRITGTAAIAATATTVTVDITATAAIVITGATMAAIMIISARHSAAWPQVRSLAGHSHSPDITAGSAAIIAAADRMRIGAMRATAPTGPMTTPTSLTMAVAASAFHPIDRGSS